MSEDLYIPPAGAMQFVFDGWPNDPIWIDGKLLPVLSRKPGCPHSLAYPVLHSPTLRMEDRSGLGLGEFSVCACWGRIIE